MIRVAEVSELPPGKGKVVELRGSRVTVYNLDGRLYATATRALDPRAPDETCGCSPGLTFDVFAEDSPARQRADERACRVRVLSGAIWLDGDED
jgi:hypothetical protein